MIKLHMKNELEEVPVFLSEAYLVSIEPVLSRYANSEISMANGKTFRVIESVQKIGELLDAGWNFDRHPNHTEAQEISVEGPG